MTSLEEFRNQMSITKSHIYFNHAGIGPISDSTLQLLENLSKSQRLGNQGIDWEPFMTWHGSVRKEISHLINCSSEEVALTNSTATGISHILSSMNWIDSKERGLILNDLEFSSNSFAYQQISKKFKIPLHIIQSIKEDGIEKLSLDDFRSKMETVPISLIGISHVQFQNGFRIDLEKLTKIAHEYDVKVLVDAMQSIGALNVDVKKLGVDFLATGGFKWCLGPLSTGFIYIKEKLLDSLEPVFVDPYSDKNPTEFLHRPFNSHDSALKFQYTFNFQASGLGEAIRLLNSVSIAKIETKIISLIEYAIEQFKNQISGIMIISPTGKEGSGILTIKFPEKVNLEETEKKLSKKHKIAISVRAGGLRFSPHAYNTEDEIDKVVSVIKNII